MEWLVGILLLLAGVVIGFFIGKFLFAPKPVDQATQQQEKTEKQLMAEQANLHIHETQAALNKIQDQCRSLTEQLSHYQNVVEETSKDKDQNQLEYFNQQASLHLKTQKKEPKNERKTDYQPLDYSEGQSGLFMGDKKKHSETS